MRLSFRSRVVLFGAAALIAAVAAQAATERRSPSPLDARVRWLEGGSPSAMPIALESLAPSDGLRSRWGAFSVRAGGGWTIYLDERTTYPTLVSGPGLRWFSGESDPPPTLAEVDRHARAFLAANAVLLGDWADLLELDRAASRLVRAGHWQLIYRQRIDGVRVENARLDLHVLHGKLVLMGTEAWARPTLDGIPTIDGERARSLLDAYLGDQAALLVPVGDPELTLMAVEGDRSAIEHRLLWRFRLDERLAPIRWIGEVDAHDGSIRAFYEGTQYATVRGGVFPVANDGDCTTGGCEAEGYPMPYADFTEAGEPVSYADDYGNLACAVEEAAFETSLSGPYVHIADTCGAIAEPGTCAAGVDLGLKTGENCAVAPGASAGNTAAARTAYYHVNRVAEIARFYNPDNPWLGSPLTVNVNVSGSCNANWDGSEINMYGAGSNCSNTGENPDILVHEWGHGYDYNDGGGVDKPSEAYSDIVAILTTRDSCMGRGMYNDGGTCSGYGDTCLTCTGFRDFDWAARQSNTPSTLANFVTPRCPSDTSQFAGPCRREAHCESYLSSEAIYDLATRDLPAAGLDQDSAWQLVDRLWYLTRPGSGGDAYTCLSGLSNSCGAASWYQRMRVADDDDGNLANGTPHAAALFAAFRRHNLACGAVGDATNQSHSSCPALAAPTLTRTVMPAGIELDWTPVANAAEYLVYRGELGCNRQQVPIASLPAPQTSFVDNSAGSPAFRYYRVEAFGANAACSGPVSNCVAAPPGSRLRKLSHRIVDDGDGTPEPGETFALPVTLQNLGLDPALSVAGRLTLTGPSVARVLGADATWPAISPNASAESDAPHFEVVVLDQASCGQSLTFELSGAASNSAPFSGTIAMTMGRLTRDYAQSAIVPIPSFTAVPVEAYFNVADDKTIVDLDVTLDIFHQAPTQLIVELTSPQGTTVRLHDRSAGSGHGVETRFDLLTAPDGPGSMADFVGESSLGTWTLAVSDLDASGVTTDGYIRPRTLHVSAEGGYDCDPQSCPDPAPSAAPELAVALAPNGGDLDLVLSWSAVAGAAGYHVLLSPDPSFATGVELIGNPATAMPVVLPDGAHATPALTFFQVRGVNSCHQEGP